MSDWLGDLAGDRLGGACVLVSVAHTRGSCPREAGTRMVVTADTCRGTIGGGHLEYQAIGVARDMLATSPAPTSPRLERFPLGARLGQCCGGLVHLSFEHVPAGRPPWVARLLELRRLGRSAVIVTRFAPLPGPSGREHDARDSASAPSDDEPCTHDPTVRERDAERRAGKRVFTSAEDDGTAADDGQHGRYDPADRAERRPETIVPPTDGWCRAEVRAREMLRESSAPVTRWEPPFLYEPFVSHDFDIRLFGAGHVGRALVDVLHPLPCAITWIDSRASALPAATPDNVQVLQSDRPEEEIDDAPPGSCLIVMTHSHALDLAICERALRRTDLGWCGLIGSMTKRRRFERRLHARGVDAGELARLVCPIGIDGIGGKHPAEIAIAVAADILRARERRQASACAHRAA